MSDVGGLPAWPPGDLERLAACPLCGAGRRNLLLDGIGARDVPGGWTLWRCRACRCGYIDPRPDRPSIGRLYRRYYTHAADAPVVEGRFGLRQRILAGYLTVRYGYPGDGRSILPRFVPAFPGARGMASQHVRDMAVPERGARLLDLGCGNGAFLARMRKLGWEVEGLEVDEVAAGIARSRGISVTGRPMSDTTFPPGRFSAITLSHSIEHLHDPVSVLRACRRTLRPGGRIWIATPNLDAGGRRMFGASWAPLDPPRHLVLFTRRSLRMAMLAAGFTDLSEPPPTLQASRWTFGASLNVRRGGDANTVLPLRGLARISALVSDVGTVLSRGFGEEICMTGTRPDSELVA